MTWNVGECDGVLERRGDLPAGSGGRLSRRGLLGAAGLGLLGMTLGIRADAAATARSEVQVVEGVPIHFARMGTGPAVTLLHGASGNLNDMTFRLAPTLAATLRQDHEVFSFDRPGHGTSGMPPGGGTSISRQAALMRQALRQAGVERTLLVGHSYGGAVALAWAVEAPETVEGLLLLSAPSQVWEGGLGLATDLMASPVTGPVLTQSLPHLVTRGFAERAVGGVFAPQAPPPGYLDHLGLDLVLQPRSLRENARQLSQLKEELRPMVPRYPGLGMPVEIVHGEADRTVGLEIHSAPLAAQIPQARLTRLPGIGHMPHQVATAAVVAAFARMSGQRRRS